MKLFVICLVFALPLVVAGCGSDESVADGAAGSVSTPGAADIPQGDWWEWAASEPEGTNPVVDDSGKDCDRNQNYDHWFLAGTFGGEATRSCTVPRGQDLVMPVLNHWSEEREDCDDFMREATSSATFDGEPIEVDQVPAREIEFEAAEGNPVVEGSGGVKAYGCGHWVRIDAPASGEHTLTVSAEAGEFALRVTYELTVE